MELGMQIKKYRNECRLSQDELAERIFVSRQSISNWENSKAYPDIRSLLLLSEVFSVSLDQLVKGDIETIKNEINAQELAKFKRDGVIFTVLFVAVIILPVLLVKFMSYWGLAVDLVLFAIAIIFAFRIERHKKRHDIQTYKEILAFTEGKSLDEIEKARETGKRPYQKAFFAIGSALMAAIFAGIIIWVLK